MKAALLPAAIAALFIAPVQASEFEEMRKFASGPATIQEVEIAASDLCANLVRLRSNQFAIAYLPPSTSFDPKSRIFRSIGLYESHPEAPHDRDPVPLTYETLSGAFAGGFYACEIKASRDLATWHVLRVSKTEDFPAGTDVNDRKRALADRVNDGDQVFLRHFGRQLEIGERLWNATSRPVSLKSGTK